MEDNSFLIDDNVIVNENTNLALRYGKITKISERVDTGEPVYYIKDSVFKGTFFWADNEDLTLDNEDLTLDKEEHE